LRKISKRTPITKFTPHFVLYRKVTEALRKCFRFNFHLFFSSLSPMLSEICLPKVFGNFTEAMKAMKTIFQRGGACRPVSSSLSNPISKMGWKGLDSNCYLHPILISSPPIFCVFGCFLFEISRNFMDSTMMSVKPSEAINNGPRMKF